MFVSNFYTIQHLQSINIALHDTIKIPTKIFLRKFPAKSKENWNIDLSIKDTMFINTDPYQFIHWSIFTMFLSE